MFGLLFCWLRSGNKGAIAFIGVNLSRGDWKSRLDKPSLRRRTDEKLGFLKPAQGMPKRFPVDPLGEHDNDWLTVWAWLNNRSKSAQVAALIAFGLESENLIFKKCWNMYSSRQVD
jgi:hypothetical protein